MPVRLVITKSDNDMKRKDTLSPIRHSCRGMGYSPQQRVGTGQVSGRNHEMCTSLDCGHTASGRTECVDYCNSTSHCTNNLHSMPYYTTFNHL